ncbi:hypothetical protein WMF30_02700 [Sorangium sp. So ce134]
MTNEKPLPEPFPNAIRVPDHVANVLARLARGWTPPPARPRPVGTFIWGGENLTNLARKIVLEGPRLIVECDIESALGRILGDNMESLNNQPFSGTTSDGAEFAAEIGGSSIHVSTSVGPKGAKRSGTMSVSGYDGFIMTNPAPLWVAKLALQNLHGAGATNLTIETPSGWERKHLCLSGSRYTYYIVRSRGLSSDLFYLVVDIGDEARPERRTFINDVHALRFALGQALRIGALDGVNGHGEIVGHVTGFGDITTKESLGRVAPPVPVHHIDGVWVSPLFRALSRELASNDTLLVPISWYVDSLLGHLDGEYVGLQVALGSLARTILERKTTQEYRLIQRPAQWALWIEQQRTHLESIAEPGYAEALIEQVRNASTPNVEWSVRRAFEELDLKLLPEMEEELRQRATVLASGEISRSAEARDVNTLVTRVEVVRCMVAALVARAIGYAGAIQGWRSGAGGYDGTADWFPTAEQAQKEAEHIYRAKTEDVPPNVVKFWPDFAAPQLPGQGLVRVLVSFAAGLAERTGGRVVAQVQPVVDAPKEERWYEFKLLLAGNPSTQSVLLTIVDPGDGTLVMRDWGEDQNIKNEDELAKFLRDFARSEDVQAAVQRMMIYAEEARQE